MVPWRGSPDGSPLEVILWPGSPRGGLLGVFPTGGGLQCLPWRGFHRGVALSGTLESVRWKVPLGFLGMVLLGDPREVVHWTEFPGGFHRGVHRRRCHIGFPMEVSPKEVLWRGARVVGTGGFQLGGPWEGIAWRGSHGEGPMD
jgi:hypothetical protein